MLKWEPNEFDIMSLAEKLTAFEGHLNSVEYVMCEIKAEILQAKESIIDLNRKSNITRHSHRHSPR